MMPDFSTISIIVSALTTLSAKSVLDNKAVDSYDKLKSLIEKKFKDNPEATFVFDKYEEKPDVWEEPLKEELIRVNADQDKNIVEIAKTIVSLQKTRQQLAYERISEQVDETNKQLQVLYQIARRSSERGLFFSLLTAALGILLNLVGVILIFFGNGSIGLVMVISGIFVDLTAGGFFISVRESRKRQELISKELAQQQTIYQALNFASKLNDEVRADYMEQIIMQILDITKTKQEVATSDSNQQVDTYLTGL